jgi:hypothetical protein
LIAKIKRIKNGEDSDSLDAYKCITNSPQNATIPISKLKLQLI